MSEEQKEDLHNIENLKTKIFSTKYDTEINPRHPFVGMPLPDKIKDSIPDEKPTDEYPAIKNKSFFKNLLVFSLVVFLGSLGYLLFNIFFAGNNISNENIEISIIGNTFVNGGERLPLVVEIINNNDVSLEFADLVVEYAKGSTVSQNNETQRLRQSIGTINAKSIINETTQVLLFGKQGSIHEIKVSLEYRIEGSSSIFVKDKIYRVTINSTPVDIAIDAPIEVTPNQDFTFKIKPTFNEFENQNNLNMLLKLDYPFGFEFIESEPKPTLGNNVWDVRELGLKNGSEITITGKMIDVYDGDLKVFHVLTGPQSSSDKSEIDVIFNSLAHEISIKRPFVETRLAVNGEFRKDYYISSNQLFLGTVNWVNNLDTAISDLEIRARFSGEGFNEENIIVNERGFYDSVSDTVVWSKSNDDRLAEVKPFASGLVSFSLRPSSIFNQKGEIIANPTINVELFVSAKQTVLGNVLNKLDSIENRVIKIFSDLSFVQTSLYSQDPIKNTGPYPPKAEQETTYTITFKVANTVNNVSKARLVASLSPRVTYKEVFVPKGADVIFNPNTREIIWNIGNVRRGEGINSPFREMSFQVGYTPSITEVDESITLLNKATLTGYDDFVNVDLSSSRNALQVRDKIIR